jgi:hypothetical protein
MSTIERISLIYTRIVGILFGIQLLICLVLHLIEVEYAFW